jgi:CheY-like chemotaxis protein
MGKKILLADDSLTIQKVVELTFSDSDYDLICVSNGQKALEKLREQRPDLILADVVMPEKNGYEVCEAIKGDPATARIPVVLLSGTFEPFDRERAERIGAEAIVSKPFDSQQLLAQVEALLDRVPPASAAEEPVSTQAVESPQTASAPAISESRQEEAPFDVGFSAEDFTASIRAPARHEGVDPFEEEYGRVDVESAIEAFEKSQPHLGLAPKSLAAEKETESQKPKVGEESAREPLAQWLGEEPEHAAARSEEAAESATTADLGGASFLGLTSPTSLSALSADLDSPETVAMKIPEPPPVSAEKGGMAPEEISEEQARTLFDVPTPPPLFMPAPSAPPEEEPSVGRSAGTTAEVPREIEELAQTSSIPELTQMLSSVARTSGNDLTDEQIERLAARVVEKLSDRVVREIAWEVIPDMAEIVIKQRIKELEAGVE